MTPWTATRSDLRLAGIAPSACVPDALRLAGVYPPSTFELPGNGFSGGERVRFAAGNGVTLDAALSPTTFYIVETPTNSDFFRVSLSSITVTLVGDGSGLPSVLEDFGPKIDAIAAQWTSYLVANATGYAPPWYTPPGWAPMIVAQLMAPTVARVLRISTSRYDVKEIADGFARAMEFVLLLRTGAIVDDGVGPIDATDGPDDSAMATNGIVQGRVCDAPWLTGLI